MVTAHAGDRLVAIATKLKQRVQRLRFDAPVTHVYNPLTYAWAPHEVYLRRYGGCGASTLLLGMNPGPWGMVQTGVPFGEVASVRDWMHIEAPVRRPRGMHPKRPIEGFGCARSEVSGRRLWGWAASRFETAEQFFSHYFVVNYCPLIFMEESARNLTPDKLPTAAQAALFRACDLALIDTVAALSPTHVVGVGKFAEGRAKKALAGWSGTIGSVLHPSPASPAANRGWSAQAEADLRRLGLAVAA